MYEFHERGNNTYYQGNLVRTLHTQIYKISFFQLAHLIENKFIKLGIGYELSKIKINSIVIIIIWTLDHLTK